jgi:hypothetical protein
MNSFSLRSISWWVLLLGLFCLGLVVRTELSTMYSFGFDQVQMVMHGQSIAEGDLELIGPRAGPTQFFTGPLPYYLMAIGWLVMRSPYAQVVYVGSVFALTYVACAWLLSQYQISKKITFIALTLFSVSPFLVALERNAWNPNLLFLAAALSLWPLLLRTPGSKVKWWEWLTVFAGGVLGYQAHFSGTLLPILVFVTACAQAGYLRHAGHSVRLLPWVVGWVASSVFGLALSLTPTILFDLRNQWLNAKGIWLFLTTTSPVMAEVLPLPQRIPNILLVMWELTGRLWLNGNMLELCILLGCLAWVGWWQSASHTRWGIGVVLVTTWAILSGYHGGTPEYYFLLLSPVWVWMWGELGRVLWRRLQFLSDFYINMRRLAPTFAAVTMFSFFFYLSFVNRAESKAAPGMRLSHQLEAAARTRQLIAKDGPHELVYDLESVDQYGLKYLLQDVESSPSANRRIHFLSPFDEEDNLAERFGPLAVWQTPIWDDTRHYVKLRSIIIETPPVIQLLESFDDASFPGADQHLIITRNSQVVGELYIYEDQGLNPATKEFLTSLTPEHPSDWTSGNWEGKEFQILNTHQTYFVALFTALPPSVTQGEILSELQFVE